MFRLRMLGSFVSGTIGFALILVTWGIYSMNQLMENLNAMDIQELLTSVLVKYIVFMIKLTWRSRILFIIEDIQRDAVR